MTVTLIEKPEANAYLRDGALILYFDMAETPFLSRFDLDSLAQANFEVADKKDGLYSLVLRDYTGQVQTIGQFSSKGDAHHALHAILKALLSHTGATVATSWNFWNFIKGILKFFLALVLLLALLYGYLWLKAPALPQPVLSPEQSAGKAPLAPAVPQGEAIDADEFLNQQNDVDSAVPPVAAPVSPAVPKE